MCDVRYLFLQPSIDSLDLIARAPSAPILSDNGILATGLYAHRRGLVFADQKSTRWLMHSCYGRLFHADGIGGPQNQAARISQRTCHAKFALTLGLRNQTTKYFSLPISQILSPYLPSFLARSLALSLSLSLSLSQDVNSAHFQALDRHRVSRDEVAYSCFSMQYFFHVFSSALAHIQLTRLMLVK